MSYQLRCDECGEIFDYQDNRYRYECQCGGALEKEEVGSEEDDQEEEQYRAGGKLTWDSGDSISMFIGDTTGKAKPLTLPARKVQDFLCLRTVQIYTNYHGTGQTGKQINYKATCPFCNTLYNGIINNPNDLDSIAPVDFACVSCNKIPWKEEYRDD